jgi:hypothetical protein
MIRWLAQIGATVAASVVCDRNALEKGAGASFAVPFELPLRPDPFVLQATVGERQSSFGRAR